MLSNWLIRTARVAVAAALLGTVLSTVASARPVPERPRQRRTFNLFAVTNAVLDVNRVYCGINNLGELCVDPTNSPVLGGGFWPKGLPDQYIFNSGLQLAGVIDTAGYTGAASFTWKGDTVGAYFFDARGTQVQGDAVTLVYNSLDAGDAAAWPNGAVVRDTAIFASALIGRDNVSQQDLWTRAWDGNPALIAGRTHPMGILVEERGLAWNYPSGNEDIIYFLFTFYNVTASNPAVYNNPTVNPAIQQEIADIGEEFQTRNEAAFNVQIPDNGYVIRDLYAAFSMDPDVGDAAHNYATAILPFSMALAYKADFLEPNFVYPPNIFGAPFVEAPGFVGVKYLKAPSPLGLTMFSNTRNAATAFPDPLGVKQLYRYLSGRIGAGDNPCSFSNPVARRLCFLDQTDQDTRFFQSSGPFVLPPGEGRTIVVAYVHAAPLDTVSNFIGVPASAQMKPLTPFTGDSIFADPSKIRAIERAAGWRSQSDVNGNLSIDQAEVTTVPRSLLNKALVAQSVYDNKFLLPFAPQGPQFFLIPADNQVTVVWQPSATETVGDPYFAVANSPVKPDLTPNPLYDPNYRQFDVEGYRIYRGRTSGDLQLIAQFDYSGTTIVDFTGGFAYGNCAPELAVFTDCPVVFDTTPPFTGPSSEHELVGNIIQVPPGGRVQLANGSILVLQADTAVTGKASGLPALADNGVTFAFVDRSVRSSFRYFYAVTAFDVNSVQSGFTSLESAPNAKPVTPRRPASNVTQTAMVTGLSGSGGVALDPTAPWPTIDAATGTFTGIIPPANDGALLLASAAVEALPAGDIEVRIDGVTPGFAGGIFLSPAGQPNLRLSLIASGDTIQRVIPLPEPAFNAVNGTTGPYQVDQALVPYDSAAARRFGINFTQDVRMPVTFTGRVTPMVNASGAVALTSGRFGVGSTAARYLAHSRWFDATGAEPPDPTIVGKADSAHHAGRLTGVGRIFAPQAYRQAVPAGGGPDSTNLNFRGFGYAQTAWYPADFVVTWNADSSLTVRDSTHRTTLPFTSQGGSGWGFVNVRSLIAAGVTAGTNPATDINDGSGAPNINRLSYQHAYGTRPTCFDDWWVIPCANLERTAQFQPLDFNSDGVQDASGIGLMINGEFFIMEMNAIPAANTRWRLRAITGEMTATCTPGLGVVMTDCSAYTFTPAQTRPSFAPGLTYKITVTQQYAVDTTTSGSLVNVHTVPDPYYVTNALEITPNTKVMKFVNLPSRAIIRIYSVSGVLVQVLYHNDAGGSGEENWNLRNRNSQVVASGVYFYHVEGPDGQTKVGRFTVVNFAQ
jgi:hypothetical protein